MWIDDHKSIVEKFKSDYTKRFKLATMPNIGILKLISDQDNIDLIRFPNLEEVKEAALSIDSNETPDSDGFGADFFKKPLAHDKKRFVQLHS